MIRPLTPELLRGRIVELFARVSDAHGPVEEIIFERVRCDGCGLTLNLLRDGYPSGWFTEGDGEQGWHDLCGVCFMLRGTQ
jgi:hypothetical protein